MNKVDLKKTQSIDIKVFKIKLIANQNIIWQENL